MILTIAWCVVIAAAIYLYTRKHYSYFSRHGVTTPPYLPFLGHMGKMVLKTEHHVDQMNRFYYDYPEDRFIGRFEFFEAMILVHDIELIKKMTIKDFDYFTDHCTSVDEDTDPLFGRNLLSIKGQKWRDMRSTLSPAFTSSKIRAMVPFMVEVGDQMIHALKNKIKESNTDYIELDVKDLTTRYTNDVIASCAFGLKVDSFSDVNNQFYVMGKNISTFNLTHVLKFYASVLIPKITKFFKITLLSKESIEFFTNVVISTVKNREENNIIRPDMIHLLMKAKKGHLICDEKTKRVNTGLSTFQESQVANKKFARSWTDEDLTAQVTLFLIAGLSSVSTGISFLLHELAMNPDVQEKLVQEIRENEHKNGGKFDYNSIQNMVYMDMVVSETLRMWPPDINMNQMCIKDYNCGKPNSKATEDYILRKGTGIKFPVWSLHHDPKYFPDPWKFDPERFSKENRHKINPLVYIPFGLGPRNCIGSRFALCEMKVMVYQLLQHMEVSPGEKTCIPAKLDPTTVGVRIKGGHWLRLRIRD